ncbi:MAG: hypothetical protein M5R36_04635 [Deltaproteobacteria bacterium]|nr:hypothetical protein [Deltaproteobacteria bacterium]
MVRVRHAPHSPPDGREISRRHACPVSLGLRGGRPIRRTLLLLYPEDCKAAVLIAAEGYTMPSSFVPTRFFLTVGSRDRGRERLAQRLADTAQRFGIAMTYHVEHGVGHALSQNQYAKAIRFLENEIASNR